LDALLEFRNQCPVKKTKHITENRPRMPSGVNTLEKQTQSQIDAKLTHLKLGGYNQNYAESQHHKPNKKRYFINL
jgi:hypothetical protein